MCSSMILAEKQSQKYKKERCANYNEDEGFKGPTCVWIVWVMAMIDKWNTEQSVRHLPEGIVQRSIADCQGR